MFRKVVGVTGGFCTGKTTVTDLFAEKGARRIDADGIAHRLLADDEDIRQKVVGLFGEGILEKGIIDRKKIAKEVFFDKDKLDALSGVLHPPIIQRIKEEIASHEEGVVVIDAPLLIEANLMDLVDTVVVVKAGRRIQIQRAISRGFSEKEALNIIEKQMPVSEKEKFADFVIDNSGDISITKEGVDRIWQKM
jgi:dephospho-CoA kinase